MTFSISWHPQAFKRLEKLPKTVIERVVKKMDVVADDPFRYLEHFETDNVFKLRIGEYRALIDIDPKTHTILIQEFDHRGRMYKRM